MKDFFNLSVDFNLNNKDCKLSIHNKELKSIKSFDSDKYNHVWRLKVEEIGNSANLFYFEFNTSIYDYQHYQHYIKNDKQPIELDNLKFAIYCFLTDVQVGIMSFTDFCDEFGYEGNGIKSRKVYRSCKHAAIKSNKFFNCGVEDLMQEFSEKYEGWM